MARTVPVLVSCGINAVVKRAIYNCVSRAAIPHELPLLFSYLLLHALPLFIDTAVEVQAVWSGEHHCRPAYELIEGLAAAFVEPMHLSR